MNYASEIWIEITELGLEISQSAAAPQVQACSPHLPAGEDVPSLEAHPVPPEPAPTLRHASASPSCPSFLNHYLTAARFF